MNVSNMAQALAARDAGISSSAEHAESDAPGWSQRAYDAVKNSPGLKRWRKGGFTMETARAYAWGHGLKDPPDLRAWGGVTVRLIRDGVIERIGYAPATSSNGSPKALYRLRTHGESE